MLKQSYQLEIRHECTKESDSEAAEVSSSEITPSEGGTESDREPEQEHEDELQDDQDGHEEGGIDGEAQMPEAQNGQGRQPRRSGREVRPPRQWWIASGHAVTEEPDSEGDHRASQYDYLINLAVTDSVIPTTYEEAVTCPESKEWKPAMDKEMESIYANDTFRAEYLPTGRKAVGCKWVYALKYAPDGSVLKYKARLVAQGCSQIFGLDYDKTYSPVARAATSRIFFTLVTSRKLHTIQADAVTAYLNGDMKEEL